jgi:hypothetical protein
MEKRKIAFFARETAFSPTTFEQANSTGKSSTYKPPIQNYSGTFTFPQTTAKPITNT